MIYTRETRSKIRFDSTMIRSRYNKIVVIHVYIIYIYTYIIYIIYTCTLYIHIYMYVYIYMYIRGEHVLQVCATTDSIYTVSCLFSTFFIKTLGFLVTMYTLLTYTYCQIYVTRIHIYTQYIHAHVIRLGK